MKHLFLLLLPLLYCFPMHGAVTYSVSFPNPESHYVQVDLEITSPKGTSTAIVMPVWTPGSYKVREFSRNVTGFSAFAGEKTLNVIKETKNRWVVKHPKGIASLKVSYTVYAFEYTVRTSYVDQFQAFLHGVSVFMYAEGYEGMSCRIRFNKPVSWSGIHVALPETAPAEFTAENYDLLADSPFALGNQDTAQFTAAGVKHRIVMMGSGNYDFKKLKKDFIRIIEKEYELFGDHPSPEYVIFIQNVESGGGGLEHLNSQTSVIQRWAYANEPKYKTFLGLIAHEYFHLWNVKRIRPVELGPFDYTTENYTRMLWVAEGITSYYDDLFLKRCQIYNEEEYLNIVATAINKHENLPGARVQSLDMSSFDAWIKFYNPDENSDNTSISYYQKGMLVSMILDLEIIRRTGGAKRFDDVLRFLYQEYYKKKNRGFTESELYDAIEKVAGSSMDDLLNKMVYTTDSLEFSKYLAYVGIDLKNHPSGKYPMGVSTKTEGGKLLVKFVEAGRAGSKAGISVNDEIIAINGFRVNSDLEDFINGFREGVPVEILVSRQGKLVTLNLIPEADTTKNYKLVKSKSLTEEQKKLFEIWLR